MGICFRKMWWNWQLALQINACCRLHHHLTSSALMDKGIACRTVNFQRRGLSLFLAYFPYCLHKWPEYNLLGIAILTSWLWCDQSILFGILKTWTSLFILACWTKWKKLVQKGSSSLSVCYLFGVPCLKSKRPVLEFWWHSLASSQNLKLIGWGIFEACFPSSFRSPPLEIIL